MDRRTRAWLRAIRAQINEMNGSEVDWATKVQHEEDQIELEKGL